MPCRITSKLGHRIGGHRVLLYLFGSLDSGDTLIHITMERVSISEGFPGTFHGHDAFAGQSSGSPCLLEPFIIKRFGQDPVFHPWPIIY